MSAKTVPDDYPRVTPYLAISGAAQAIEFYKNAFGATERMRMDGPEGKVGHAEIDIEGGLIMRREARGLKAAARRSRGAVFVPFFAAQTPLRARWLLNEFALANSTGGL